MVFAFVLADLKKQTEKEFVFEKLKRITEVKKTYLIDGNYDFLMEMEAESLLHLRETVSKRLSLTGVKSTLFMLRI